MATETKAKAGHSEAVFVTADGSKSHRAGCRDLAWSSISRTLADLPLRYEAGSFCRTDARNAILVPMIKIRS
jgi:hypothetical protein